jgi:propanediol dehydratase large subunit
MKKTAENTGLKAVYLPARMKKKVTASEVRKAILEIASEDTEEDLTYHFVFTADIDAFERAKEVAKSKSVSLSRMVADRLSS